MGEQGETDRDVSRVEVVLLESSDGDLVASNVNVSSNSAMVIDATALVAVAEETRSVFTLEKS